MSRIVMMVCAFMLVVSLGCSCQKESPAIGDVATPSVTLSQSEPVQTPQPTQAGTTDREVRIAQYREKFRPRTEKDIWQSRVKGLDMSVAYKLARFDTLQSAVFDLQQDSLTFADLGMGEAEVKTRIMEAGIDAVLSLLGVFKEPMSSRWGKGYFTGDGSVLFDDPAGMMNYILAVMKALDLTPAELKSTEQDMRKFVQNDTKDLLNCLRQRIASGASSESDGWTHVVRNVEAVRDQFHFTLAELGVREEEMKHFGQ